MKILLPLFWALFLFSSISLAEEGRRERNRIPVHGGSIVAGRDAVNVATTVQCKAVEVDKSKAIRLSSPQKTPAQESKARGSRKENACSNVADEGYKVILTLKSNDSSGVTSSVESWEVFQDYQAAKDFKDQVKKSGKYQLCTFSPPNCPPWTEVVVDSQD